MFDHSQLLGLQTNELLGFVKTSDGKVVHNLLHLL